MVDNRTKALLGYWLDAIGQTMSAVVNTPALIEDEALSMRLDLWGSVLQGTGAALVADSEADFTLEKLGNQLESTGNLVSVISLIAPVNDALKTRLDKSGDIIETLGVSIALPDTLKEGLTLDTLLDVYGHFLQIIDFKGVNEEEVTMIAEWSQAIAAIISLVNAIHE